MKLAYILELAVTRETASRKRQEDSEEKMFWFFSLEVLPSQ